MKLRNVKTIMECDLLRLRKSSGFLISTTILIILLGLSLASQEGRELLTDLLGYDAIPRMLIFVTTMVSASFAYNAIIAERESGSLELLSTIPLSRLEILLGKLLAPITLGLLICIIPLTFGALHMFSPLGVAAIWIIALCTSAALSSILFLFFVSFKTRELARLGWVVGLIFVYPGSHCIPGFPSFFAAKAIDKIVHSTFFIIPEAVYIITFTIIVLFITASVFSRKETALLR